MAKRYFICTENGSNKFWNIQVYEAYGEYICVVHYGKIGSTGQTNEKVFDTEKELEQEANTLIEQKLKKGYVESKDIDLKYFMGTKSDETNNSFDDDSIKELEEELGYKIPSAYIDLLKIKDGDEEWRRIGDKLLDMTGFEGIDGLSEMYSVVDEWGYPDIGIYFAWTESGGHEALLMNYKECLNENEPSIWLLDQEGEFGVFLAKNFEDFIKQLYFDSFESRFEEALKKHYSEYINEDNNIVKDFSDWT